MAPSPQYKFMVVKSKLLYLTVDARGTDDEVHHSSSVLEVNWFDVSRVYLISGQIQD
jgi:hypothetical protein